VGSILEMWNWDGGVDPSEMVDPEYPDIMSLKGEVTETNFGEAREMVERKVSARKRLRVHSPERDGVSAE
jgi:hypothetical protein